jgi:glycosyltransferase involved in cell wall biosynthesis
LPRWYRAADVFVLPSVNEGWGLVVLEALAASLPVIVSDLPVFQEYLTRDDVVMVPTHDADALAAAMIRVARDPELRRVLARRGPAIARGFGWDTTARQHQDVYGAVTAGVG